MKKTVAMASALAILGAFSIASTSEAGRLQDVLKKAIAKVKTAKKLVPGKAQGVLKQLREAMKARIEAWKKRIAALKGKAKALAKRGLFAFKRMRDRLLNRIKSGKAIGLKFLRSLKGVRQRIGKVIKRLAHAKHPHKHLKKTK